MFTDVFIIIANTNMWSIFNLAVVLQTIVLHDIPVEFNSGITVVLQTIVLHNISVEFNSGISCPTNNCPTQYLSGTVESVYYKYCKENDLISEWKKPQQNNASYHPYALIL